MPLGVGDEHKPFPSYFRKPYAASAGVFAGVSFRLCPPSITRPIDFKLACPNIRCGSFEEWFLGRLGLSPVHSRSVRHQAIDFHGRGTSEDKLDDAEIPRENEKKAERAGTDLFLLMSGALDASQKGSEFRPDWASFQLRSIGRSFGPGFPQLRCRRRGQSLSASVEALKPLADEA